MEYSPSPVVLSPVSKPKNMAATPAKHLQKLGLASMHPQDFVNLEPTLIDAYGCCTV